MKNQFFYLITEHNDKVMLRIYVTETRVLYSKNECTSLEVAHEYGRVFCDQSIHHQTVEYINTEFTKLFPGNDHLT